MKSKLQFIAGIQTQVLKTINWKTGRINKLKPKAISTRDQALMAKGLLHINVHHPKCKLLKNYSK